VKALRILFGWAIVWALTVPAAHAAGSLPPPVEPSEAEMTAGTLGLPYTATPRRVKAAIDAAVIAAGAGDISGVTAGVGLSGGGDTGALTLTFAPAELGDLSWGPGSAATIAHTFNLSGTDVVITYGSGSWTSTGHLNAPFLTMTPLSDAAAGTFRRYSSGQTAYILQIQTEANAFLAGVNAAGQWLGDGSALTIDASSFNGNLATTDNTLPEIAQKLDDLVASGTDDQTAAEVAVTPAGNLAADDVQEALGELQGDIDSLSAGTVADDSITAAKMADGDHGDFTYATNVASIDAGVVTVAKMADSLDLSGKTAVAVPTIAGSTDNDTSAASTAFVQAVAATKQDADADLTTAAGASEASNSTFFGKNASGTVGFHSISGSGDVVGPASATDNAIARFDTTTGKLIQNSAVTIDDSGNMSGIGTLDVGVITADEMSIPARAAGTTLSGWGEIWLPSPGHVRGTAVTLNSAAQAPNDGCAIFADDVEANNWVEWSRLSVPQDYDTTADPIATLHIVLSDSDTADHAYKITMVPIAPSAQSASTLANEITLTYTPDASGASGDVQVATATLTGWGAALSGTGGQRWRIRVTRDGDDATNDTSTADSVLVGLSIRYPYVQ
jgi:hypothetical protein